MKINIKLRKKYLDTINNQIKIQYGSKRRIYVKLICYYNVPYDTFETRLKPSYPYFIDFEIIYYLCKILFLNLFEMQRNIIAYKSRKGVNYIVNPILPIRITPIFDMLIAHNIGDGTVIDPKNNRKPYFGYRQCNPNFMSLYVKKIESVFGKLRYNRNKIDTTRTYFPTVVSDLIFRHYNLNTKSFLSKKARIPPQLFNKNKESMLAFLLAIIIDDGHVDSNLIVIGLKNTALAQDLERLCNILNYDCSYKARKMANGIYGYLYILKNGVVKLWNDYLVLKRNYPMVSMGYKEQKIRQSFLIYKRKIIRTKGNCKKILNILLNKTYSVNELANLINMTRQGVRYHIHVLEIQQKIQKVGFSNNNILYSGIKSFK